MQAIERKERLLAPPAQVVNRGGDTSNQLPNYFIEIPKEYPGVDGHCLPLCIIFVILLKKVKTLEKNSIILFVF